MGFLMETDYQIRKLRPWAVSRHPRDLLQWPGSRAPLLLHGPCAVAPGPRLKGAETRLAYDFPVTRFMLLE